jgi:hypothetical protein
MFDRMFNRAACLCDTLQTAPCLSSVYLKAIAPDDPFSIIHTHRHQRHTEQTFFDRQMSIKSNKSIKFLPLAARMTPSDSAADGFPTLRQPGRQ